MPDDKSVESLIMINDWWATLYTSLFVIERHVGAALCGRPVVDAKIFIILKKIYIDL